MRRIRKGAAPRVLSGTNNRGPRETARLLADYDAGVRDFEFNSDIYAAASVKAALQKAQADKCGFCESKFAHIAYGDVEHFRPKGGYRQSEGDPLTQPGYYWLAYEWSNLFVSCTLCNQRFKRNLFPLGDPSTRAVSHNDNVSREQPLFINPELDEPREHIAFREEVAYPVDGSPRGFATIECFGLNRDPLLEQRRTLLTNFQLLWRTLIAYEMLEAAGAQLPDDVLLNREAIRIQVKSLQRPAAEYSAMITDAGPHGPVGHATVHA